MRASRLTLIAGLLSMAWLPSHAAASALRVRLDASLRPERLGAQTTIQFGFTIAAGDEAPPALTDVRLSLPADFGIAESGLGLVGCKPEALEANGSRGCPANSVMGHGSALVEVPFGPGIVSETARTVVFAAPVENQQLEMLFLATGESPVIANLLFPAELVSSTLPSGGVLDAKLPLVQALPGAPDIAVVKLTASLGPAGVTYYAQDRGRRIPYRPKGILLPKSCPPGGFRFAAAFEFANHTKSRSNATVLCPRSRRR